MSALLDSFVSEYEWQDRAACRGPQAVVFYPPPRSERRDEKREREQSAKDICAQCSVIDTCLEHAIVTGEVHGVWGGTNEIERRNLVLDREHTKTVHLI